MKLRTMLSLGATALLAASAAAAQAPKQEDLKALVKISKDSARKVALSRVAAGSKVKSSELEREKGTIVYSFDIKLPKQPGVEEILVSALDGSVVSQSHETPKQERAEAAADRKAAKKKTP